MASSKNPPTEESILDIVNAMLNAKAFLDATWSNQRFNITDYNNEVTDGTGEIANFVCPILVCHGRDDKIIQIEKVERSVVSFLEKYNIKHEKHFYDDCGHGVL